VSKISRQIQISIQALVVSDCFRNAKDFYKIIGTDNFLGLYQETL